MVAGDIGQPIRVNCKIDVSGASVMRIEYRKPSGTKSYWIATAYEDEELGTTTKIQFITTAATDVPESGVWQLQPYVEKGTWKKRGIIAEMYVYPTLP